jgi:phosphatidylglycerophosphate synthase
VSAGGSVSRGRGNVALTAGALLVLLALVALAAGARPLHVGNSKTGQPSTTFFDYAWTTLIIVIVAAVLGAAWAIFRSRQRIDVDGSQRGGWAAVPIVLALAALFARAIIGSHLSHLVGARTPPVRTPNAGLLDRAGRAPDHTAQFRWQEALAVALVLVAVAAVVVIRRRRRAQPLRSFPIFHRDEVSAALDDAVDDLRAEPDVRRAVIAAYARTERALAAARIPRRASEAPFEYLERALAELDASAPSIRRLTELFERAKFSAGELGPEVREEAIAALLAVRDDLAPRSRRQPVLA